MSRFTKDGYTMPNMIAILCKNSMEAAIDLTVIATSPKEQNIGPEMLFGLDSGEIYDEDILTLMHVVCQQQSSVFIKVGLCLKYKVINPVVVKTLIEDKEAIDVDMLQNCLFELAKKSFIQALKGDQAHPAPEATQ